MAEPKQIGEIEKGPMSRIVVSLTEFRGNYYFDIREYIKSESYTGPTKKGIRLDVELYPKFKEIIEELGKEIEKKM